MKARPKAEADEDEEVNDSLFCWCPTKDKAESKAREDSSTTEAGLSALLSQSAPRSIGSVSVAPIVPTDVHARMLTPSCLVAIVEAGAPVRLRLLQRGQRDCEQGLGGTYEGLMKV